MRAIFISYRREDTEGQAGRLFDDLVAHFGETCVFMDVVGIEPHRDFRKVIDQHVANCGVLLALIGQQWLDVKDTNGRRRLDDPMDFVRLETAAALKRDIPVIPILVQNASMPRAEQLPIDLVDLAYRNGLELTTARWDSDVQVLIDVLSAHVIPPERIASASSSPEHVTPLMSNKRIPLLAIATASLVAIALLLFASSDRRTDSVTEQMSKPSTRSDGATTPDAANPEELMTQPEDKAAAENDSPSKRESTGCAPGDEPRLAHNAQDSKRISPENCVQ